MGDVARPPGATTFRWPSGATFDAGALCLDLAYTGGTGALAVFEVLHRPADLRAWVRRPPLSLPVGQLDLDDLAAARALREDVRSVLAAVAAGRAAPPSAVRRLERVAAEPPPAPRLRADGALAWQTPVTGAQVLSVLARDALETAAGGRVRECPADDCPLLFVDDTGSRRWCSMQRCGNRAKVRAHRERTGQAQTWSPVPRPPAAGPRSPPEADGVLPLTHRFPLADRSAGPPAGRRRATPTVLLSSADRGQVRPRPRR